MKPPPVKIRSLEPAAALAQNLFSRLAEETSDFPGVTRVAYGPGESRANALMAQAASAFNAEIVFDAAGNQFITLPGSDRSRRIVIGSHLDSVPHGGNFDGAAGVILGIAVQAALAEHRIEVPYDLTVACLRAEESCWFPHSYIGSKTALGRLDPAVLDACRRSDTGKSLADHMTEAGFDPAAVRRGDTFLSPQTTVAYIEPHIEQAPLLLSQSLAVGAVTGIRGSFRYRQMRCCGEYSHSGAMPRTLRRDAAIATARLMVSLQDLWERLEAEGADLTVTFGQISTDPLQHSFSKVAGETRICLDVRSQSVDTLARVDAELKTLADEIGKATGTRFELGPRSGSEPARMSDELVALMLDSCERLKIPSRRMASGAGHDAATFAQAGIPSAMLFIRNANGSHNPDEHMDAADFETALAVVFDMLLQPADRWPAGDKNEQA